MRRALCAALVWVACMAAMLQLGCRRSCPSCASVPPVAPAPLPEVKVITERVACLFTEPPVPAEFTAKGAKDGCPAPFTTCLERPDAVALRKYLDDLETWSAAAWLSCRIKVAPIPHPEVTP